jgi:hypothetical protein
MTKKTLSTLSMAVLTLGVLAAFVLTFGSCASTGVRPYRGGGIELTSEVVGWEQPPQPRLPWMLNGFNPPVGSIDFTAAPVQIRVGVRNGRDYPMRFVLSCGEVGFASHDTEVVVAAETEQALYFSMPRRIGHQSFECRFKSLSAAP